MVSVVAAAAAARGRMSMATPTVAMGDPVLSSCGISIPQMSKRLVEPSHTLMGTRSIRSLQVARLRSRLEAMLSVLLWLAAAVAASKVLVVVLVVVGQGDFFMILIWLSQNNRTL
jgi:hypothetical protein